MPAVLKVTFLCDKQWGRNHNYNGLRNINILLFDLRRSSNFGLGYLRSAVVVSDIIVVVY